VQAGNKKLLIVLAVIAAGVWVYNMRLFRSGPENTQHISAPASSYKALLSSQSYTYVADFRDPFECPLVPKAKPSQAARKKEPQAAPPSPPQPPRISIGGINWNAMSPMVLMQGPAGSSLVGVGDSVAGALIKAIFMDSVSVLFEGREFTIK